MDRTFITQIRIDSVRHLHDLTIPLSSDSPKHLILTGRNGSGKTSLLDALATNIGNVAKSDAIDSYKASLDSVNKLIFKEEALMEYAASEKIAEYKMRVSGIKDRLDKKARGLFVDFNPSGSELRLQYSEGNFIIAYFDVNRGFKASSSNHIEKVELKDKYEMTEHPRELFIRYLADMKFTEAFARNNGNTEKADAIKAWFDKFEALLKDIFDDNTLRLVFNEETFSFDIIESGRDPFDFNTLASGFSAVLDIVADIMMRMAKKTNRSFVFNLPGIVLIDEIETHLHLELQKRIMPLLTTIFPKVQFVVSTHSPFILNSLSDVVIYDLEKHTCINEEEGLTDVPYSGIVEGYFDSDQLSIELKDKFNRYKELVGKGDALTDEEILETGRLELYLDEIPDYLALGISTEYKELKARLRNRKDL